MAGCSIDAECIRSFLARYTHAVEGIIKPVKQSLTTLHELVTEGTLCRLDSLEELNDTILVWFKHATVTHVVREPLYQLGASIDEQTIDLVFGVAPPRLGTDRGRVGKVYHVSERLFPAWRFLFQIAGQLLLELVLRLYFVLVGHGVPEEAGVRLHDGVVDKLHPLGFLQGCVTGDLFSLGRGAQLGLGNVIRAESYVTGSSFPHSVRRQTG